MVVKGADASLKDLKTGKLPVFLSKYGIKGKNSGIMALAHSLTRVHLYIL